MNIAIILQAISFLYSVNLAEYVAIDARVSVCLSVCLCHLYSPKEWTDLDETFHKSPAIQLLNSFFSPILNIQIDDVMAAIIATFKSGTLKVAILLRFYSILGREGKTRPVFAF